MTGSPRFKLYSDETAPIYTFLYVQDTNHPQAGIQYVEHNSRRASGASFLTGGYRVWDLTIDGFVTGANYDELVTAMDLMVSTITPNTAFTLTIDKSDSTVYTYNVVRVAEIEFPDKGSNKMRRKQPYRVTFKVLSAS